MQNGVLVSYPLRVVSILPGDIVSMFLGAYGIRYPSYVIGSILGLTPIMVPATMMGSSITDPFSLRFLLSFLAMIAISLVSSLLCNRYMRKKKKKTKDKRDGALLSRLFLIVPTMALDKKELCQHYREALGNYCDEKLDRGSPVQRTWLHVRWGCCPQSRYDAGLGSDSGWKSRTPQSSGQNRQKGNRHQF